MRDALGVPDGGPSELHHDALGGVERLKAAFASAQSPMCKGAGVSCASAPSSSCAPAPSSSTARSGRCRARPRGLKAVRKHRFWPLLQWCSRACLSRSGCVFTGLGSAVAERCGFVSGAEQPPFTALFDKSAGSLASAFIGVARKLKLRARRRCVLHRQVSGTPDRLRVQSKRWR